MPDTARHSLEGVHKDGIKEAVLKPPCFAVKGIILSEGRADRWFTGASDLPMAYEGEAEKRRALSLFTFAIQCVNMEGSRLVRGGTAP